MRMQIVLTLMEVLNASVSQVTLEMERIVKVWTDKDWYYWRSPLIQLISLTGINCKIITGIIVRSLLLQILTSVRQ